MHQSDEVTDRIMSLVADYVVDRLRLDPVPLDHPESMTSLAQRAPNLIGERPRPPEEVFAQFTNVLATSVISVDSPRYLSFIPAAPTKASLMFDMVVSASSLNATSWLDASGAVHAENQALAVLAAEMGMPVSAGGCFVSGGSAGNLSALAVARDAARRRLGDARAATSIVCSDQAHSSVSNTAHLLDVDVITVPTVGGRLTGRELAAVVSRLEQPKRVMAVVATAGTTNLGIVDELDAIAAVVIGGTSLLGGRFSIPMSVLGALIIQAMNTGILISGFSPEFNLVVKSAVIILILVLQSPIAASLVQRRRAAR